MIATHPRPAVTPLLAWYETLMPGAYARLGDLVVGRVLITPEIASYILDKHNLKNRAPIKTQIAMLASDIAADRFLLTGETLIFDREQRLINGQNRLHAVVQSSGAIETLVVVGVDPNVFQVLDQQSRRTLGQVLQITGEVNTTTVASAITFFEDFLQSGTICHAHPEKRLTIVQRIKLVSMYPGLRECASYMKQRGKVARMFRSIGLAVAMRYVFMAADRELGAQFFDHLLNYNVPTDGRWNATKLLLTRLVNNLSETSKLPKKYISALTTKAWNSLIADRTLKVLRFNDEDEEFPVVDGFTYTDGVPEFPAW